MRAVLHPDPAQGAVDGRVVARVAGDVCRGVESGLRGEDGEQSGGVDVRGLGSEEACERVKGAFENGVVDGECRGFFSAGGSWRGLEARGTCSRG